jgi:transcriptional regulator with XRE-family HTH domain
VAANLRALRLDGPLRARKPGNRYTGRSLRELAAQVGVAPETIRRWELGVRCPQCHHLAALAAALGISPMRLRGVIDRAEAARENEFALSMLPALRRAA